MEVEHWRTTARTLRLERETDIEIKNQLKEKTDIITKIDETKLRRFSEVKSMGDNRPSDIMLKWKPTGKSGRGNPKKAVSGQSDRVLKKIQIKINRCRE